jgi:uncharacterized protein
MSGQQSRAEALIAAVRSGDPGEVAAVLATGAPVDVRDDDDWSPLDRAAGSGNDALVRLLLDSGADATATGRERRTAYEIALAAGHRSTAQLLRRAEEEADPQAAERHQWRPYCRAYQLAELRAFHGWQEPADADLGDADVVFVHDDLTVTRSIWPGEDMIFTGRSEDWNRFCRDTLSFRVPDDFDLLPSGGVTP